MLRFCFALVEVARVLFYFIFFFSGFCFGCVEVLFLPVVFCFISNKKEIFYLNILFYF